MAFSGENPVLWRRAVTGTNAYNSQVLILTGIYPMQPSSTKREQKHELSQYL